MTTDPWVGTWRPQKPLRPIGAQYTGPGPKYGLPSATGIIKHDPTKNKAPAYSFGIQHVRYNTDSSPGPKYFVSSKMTRMGKDAFPAFTMCFRSKEPKKAKTPGPATYFPEKAIKCSYNTPPAYTMGSKTEHFEMDSVPGSQALHLTAMKMDLNAVIETVEAGYQDAAMMALQAFNKERLGKLVIRFLERDLQPSCQLACLETIRILSRDKNCLEPFATPQAIQTLGRHAGIKHSEGVTSEIPDLEVIVEALKCLCNIVFNSPSAQEVGAELRLIVGLTERLKLYNDRHWSHEVRFFDLRLTFLFTALRVDVRGQLAHELRGISLLSDALESTLGLRWLDTFEVARADKGDDGLPLPRQETERTMEILKILFNITFDTSRRDVDEEEAALYRHLCAILRFCLMSKADGEERTEEFHSHTVNLLGNLPLMCLDVLLTPKVQQGSIEYMGVNMDAVSMLLDFMDRRLNREHKLKETLTPSLNLLTESARVHRETRKFLRMKILPPLRDVKNRPEVGNSLRNKLVRLMTHIDTDVKHCAAELLFVLCKESVPCSVIRNEAIDSRTCQIKFSRLKELLCWVAAGLLAARGLMCGGRGKGRYSEDEDTDTEEYREAKPNINPITGRVEEKLPNPMEGMTEEQKENEAMKLVNMFDKMSRDQVIQPMAVGPDGKLANLESAVQRLSEQRSSSGSDSDDD
ncbi:Synembryn-A [Acipenser ruthenus]|uniref:Synembryn n=1 Tax=Acipenser ruthenus TaxID=7906 RepID=A0A662YYT1_ACIRT|nr:Synembryn-A [Acipenser ruthenus]